MDEASMSQVQAESITPEWKWYTPLTKVTPLSKYFAMVLFLALPFAGFWLGVEYRSSGAAVPETLNRLVDNMPTAITEVRDDSKMPATSDQEVGSARELSIRENSNSSENASVSNDARQDVQRVFTSELGTIDAVFDGQGISAKLVATDAKGLTNTVPIPYGVDEVFGDRRTTGYFVVTTNRENDRMIDFDEVLVAFFDDNGPRIVHVMGSGFGKYDKSQGRWLYIPFKDRPSTEVISVRDMQVQVVGLAGKRLDTWSFGEALVSRYDWNDEYVLNGTEIIGNGELVLNFGGSCEQAKYSVCARYVLDPTDHSIGVIIY